MERWPEPEYGKEEVQLGRHYQPMTWTLFQVLRHWAQDHVPADAEPFLVGSATHKTLPRDCDIAVIYPYDRWVELCTNYDFKGFPNEYEYVHTHLFSSASDAVAWQIWIDIKVHPDHWFSYRERIPLRRWPFMTGGSRFE